ncbi:MAG: M67 family metallopeptidase [Thermodesulfobacteriota bacterium]|nr:M67 family metallopeptidase [Thermodesulfobacteriota bacterium]
MLKIPKPIFERMIDHAKMESPLECCGILSGRDKTVEKVFELQNSEKSPIRYSISPQEQLEVFKEMEKEAMEMVAIYHSHTHTIPFPSETDVRMAFYPEVSSIIISLKEEDAVVKAFLIREDVIHPEEIEVIL